MVSIVNRVFGSVTSQLALKCLVLMSFVASIDASLIETTGMSLMTMLMALVGGSNAQQPMFACEVPAGEPRKFYTGSENYACFHLAATLHELGGGDPECHSTQEAYQQNCLD